MNVSAVQFRQKGFLDSVRLALAESGLAPECLELELTESAVMHHASSATDTLEQLNKIMGVHVSIDDFGTGYSSLSYLKRFPLNALKIDRSFVRDLSTDPDDAAIVRAIVAMAHNLRLSVVAEGVETAGQLAFLRDVGCDEYQGYYCSRPLPVEEFGALLAARRAGPGLEAAAPAGA